MLGLRSKLLLALIGMLVVVLIVSILGQTVLDRYSAAIGRSYREDYESVAVCQQMKEIVEQMNSIAQDALWGRSVDLSSIDAMKDRFEQRLATQRRDATLPGELAATERLASSWEEYVCGYLPIVDPSLPVNQRRQAYVENVLPRSRRVISTEQQLIDMNLTALLSVPGKTQTATNRAHWAMRFLTLSAGALAVIFALLVGRTILRPIRALTDSVHEIERGNLDLSVPVRSADELGTLALAFNRMAENLRAYRQIAHDRLVRTERTTQLAIDSLPDAVIVANPQGKVELANEVARRLLGLAPGDNLERTSMPWLAELWRRMSDTGHTSELSDYETTVQLELNHETRAFLPRTAPILDESRRPIGATVVLADVTGLRRLDEMKNNLLSLVSHELKTPLTSARMILHLISDQKVGPLTEKQRELLIAARDDTERLHRIVESLLDMSRIESGRALMDLEPLAPDQLVRRSVEPLAATFQSQQVELQNNVAPDLPAVLADPVRIGHVFANLLMNSLRYTPGGGRVQITAARRSEFIEFTVRDNGAGIPRQYLHRVFEKFFRVPGQGRASGSGLGLAIAKDIVEAHGGQIRAENELSGAAFAFTLRTIRSPEPQVPIDRAPAAAARQQVA